MAVDKKTENAKEGSKEKSDIAFPDFVPLEEDKIASMTHEEKLKLIEKEAQTLYDFCLEKGFSKKDLSWCLKPLFGSPPEYVKKVVKDNAKFCLTVGITFGLIAIVVGWSPAYNVCCVHGKLALMKLLPYWDWTYIYDQDCLVKNPYVAPQPNMTKEECQSCFDLTKNGIEGLKNATHETIANDFLLVHFPAIIEDGTRGWPKPNLNLESLSQDYNNHKDLDSVGDCRFNSSIPDIANVYDFFNAYETNLLPATYFAQWENCELKAAKHFRLNYKRPYYLPPMAEASKVNSILVSRGKSDDSIPWSYDEENSGLWLTVVKGKLAVDLEPVEGCASFDGCGTIGGELKKGEAIVVPLHLWQVDVTPLSEGDTIAIGSTMQWDENEGLPEEAPDGGKNEGNDK